MREKTPPTRSDSNDPFAAIGPYMQNERHLHKTERWRAKVTFRCKKRHQLGMVIKTPQGMVLYSLRGERQWPGDNPSPMATLLPELVPNLMDVAFPIGGCRCSKLRTLTLAEIWQHVPDTPTSAEVVL